MAIGREGFPFNLGAVSYTKGLCPVTERLHERELVGFEVCAYDFSDVQVGQLVEAVRKVHSRRAELSRLE